MGDTSQLRLSFAIPTYNFGNFLKATVDSIFAGLPKEMSPLEIEVVIVDGASIDHTQEVVRMLTSLYPSIKYVKMPHRGGIDFDLNHAVSLCKAPFVWMLSADDVLIENWGQTLLPLLAQNQPDIVLIPAVVCTLDMTPMRRNRIFSDEPDSGAHVFQLDQVTDVETYLNSAVTLEALFSFMSAILIKRETWERLRVRDDYFGTCWAHCARLAPLLSSRGSAATIVYLNEFLLQKRSGNDSFMEHGLIRRIGITINGWTRIIDEFYGDDLISQRLYQLMRRDCSLILFLYAKLGCCCAEDATAVTFLAKRAYGSTHATMLSRLKLFCIFIMPSFPRVQKSMTTITPILVRLKHRVIGLFH